MRAIDILETLEVFSFCGRSKQQLVREIRAANPFSILGYEDMDDHEIVYFACKHLHAELCKTCRHYNSITCYKLYTKPTSALFNPGKCWRSK